MRGLTYALNEATQSLLRGWRAALLAVITIAAGLFVLGFFMIVNTNLQPIVARWTEAAELSVPRWGAGQPVQGPQRGTGRFRSTLIRARFRPP